MPFAAGVRFRENEILLFESGRISGGIPEQQLPPTPPAESGEFGYTQINVLDGEVNAAQVVAYADILLAEETFIESDDAKTASAYAYEDIFGLTDDPAIAKQTPEAQGLSEQNPLSLEDFERENSIAHWVLFTHLDCLSVGTVNVDTPLPVSTGSSQQVIASPNTVDGYVLFQFLLDGSSVGAGSANGANYLERVYTVAAGTSGQHKHLTLDFRVGYVIAADSSCTPTGYNAIESGQTLKFTAAIGSPPQGYRYQWYLDGAPVGSNSSTYTPPAQTNGTYHTLSVAHVPL